MRLSIPFASLLLALSLTACSAPAPSPETPSSTATTPASPAVADPARVAPVPPKATPAPVIEERAGGFDPMSPDRTCKTDADCTVKNVGNCCGRFPLCVNKDAKVDPNAVRAQCAKDGVASTCGFQEVGGCQCVQGRCENLANGAAVM